VSEARLVVSWLLTIALIPFLVRRNSAAARAARFAFVVSPMIGAVTVCGWFGMLPHPAGLLIVYAFALVFFGPLAAICAAAAARVAYRIVRRHALNRLQVWGAGVSPSERFYVLAGANSGAMCGAFVAHLVRASSGAAQLAAAAARGSESS